MSIVTRILGDPFRKDLKRYWNAVSAINNLAPEMAALSDEELAAKTAALRERIGYEGPENILGHTAVVVAAQLAKVDQDVDDVDDEDEEAHAESHDSDVEHETLHDILPEAFALVREASERVLGMRHYDVQMVGGIVLFEGRIAEMRTGEGKTLVATAPLYLRALEGKGAHLVTVNDYLARRDAGWNGALFSFLGLKVGVITGDHSLIYDPDYVEDGAADDRLIHLRPCSRRDAYMADITYCTNHELGFDYLRDNMARTVDACTQRRLNYAIVDEVDSILIDEARTPLIISGPSSEGKEYVEHAYAYAGLVKTLKEDIHYEVDEEKRSVTLTDEGLREMEKRTGISNIYAPEHSMVAHQMDRALHAHALYKENKDYIVREVGPRQKEIVIVNEFTGRTLAGQRWSAGIHQAIEAKHGVTVKPPDTTYASITFQNFFRLYETIAGMTGTAVTEAEELHKIYKLDVIPIPTHRPVARLDQADRIYMTQDAKSKAIVAEVKERYAKGQPILIGTTSVKKSEELSEALTKAGVPHSVLNAKRHEQEARIVADAGQRGAVTIATNMAGRGTDIVLGEGVADLGGLYIVGTERHDSRRIDNQLRGRSGRQGDPGESRFFLSYDDDLMRIFGGETTARRMRRVGLDEDTPIEMGFLTKRLEGAQARVEGNNFDARRSVVERDDVLSRQREFIYADRRKILDGSSTRDNVERMVGEVIERLVQEYCEGRHAEKWDMSGLWSRLREMAPLPPEEEVDLDAMRSSQAEVIEAIEEEFTNLYEEKRERYGDDVFSTFEQQVMLSVIDRRWQLYLTEIEIVKEGINFRGQGQMDPNVEFKREAFTLFEALKDEMTQEIVRSVFQGEIRQVEPPAPTEVPTAAAEAAAPPSGRADTPGSGALSNAPPSARPAGAAVSGRLAKVAGVSTNSAVATTPSDTRTTVRLQSSPGAIAEASGRSLRRNDLCPCGSGRKYKRCHGADQKKPAHH